MEQLQQRYPSEVVHLPIPLTAGAVHKHKIAGTTTTGCMPVMSKTSTSCWSIPSCRLTLEQLISQACRLPQSVAIPLSRYAGGVYNHILYFYGMMPQSQQSCCGPAQVRYLPFLRPFDHSAAIFRRQQAVFGWLYMACARQKELEIINI